ncbi:NAD-dependent epimerase/dehydratase family protein [Limnoglobus roseus]|uniref:LPS biosynthesis protein WbpP n=1 Tax=Limnoglobus roseus TaxID=2598579 RepID=A0A5C1AJB4_9BACT|nr:NAD-dependent epimerase/dehydratase family protein [Limnoglobus roseus]QEL17224.1 LPS biosynthesis protein WbpP [Limnoglobus roseus]
MAELSLVTGGAGFIGSHVVEELTRLGRPVRVFDDFSTGLRENFTHLAVAPEVVEGSLTDGAAVARAVAGAGVVYHLGAMASVAKSLEAPLDCHAVCATGTLNVLEAARKHGVRRVVYAASSSAYGGADDPAGQDEQTPLETLSPYAAAKLAGEMYLQAFAASFGVETVRVRFFNIFGPRQRADSPYSGVIAIFAAALLNGRVPTVHGDGGQSRDFTYVANAVQALLRAAETPGVSGRVYNAGTGRSVSLLELVAALNRILGTDVTPTHGPARLGDVRFSKAKIEKIQSELGYQPTVDFEEGLRRTVDWMKG